MTHFIFHFYKRDVDDGTVQWKLIENRIIEHIVDEIDCLVPVFTLTRDEKPRAVMQGIGKIDIIIRDNKQVAVIHNI